MATKLVRRAVKTSSAPRGEGAASQAVIINNRLHISGQCGFNYMTNDLDPEVDVQDQARIALRNIGAILKEAGTSFDHVVEVTIALTDLENDFTLVDLAYLETFKPPYPARTVYQVAALPKKAKVCISALAVIGILNKKSDKRSERNTK